jgi:serine/threonine-protein kinase RsbW
MNLVSTEISHIRIASDLSSLALVESLIDDISKESGFSDDLYGNILIAVTEAVNNAIIHGNCFNSSQRVDIHVGQTQEQYCFTVKDEGSGFDFTNLPDPTSPENIEKENGRGIFLINNLSDKLEFTNGGNTLSIYFNK